MTKRICDRCGAEIPASENKYKMYLCDYSNDVYIGSFDICKERLEEVKNKYEKREQKS